MLVPWFSPPSWRTYSAACSYTWHDKGENQSKVFEDEEKAPWWLIQEKNWSLHCTKTFCSSLHNWYSIWSISHMYSMILYSSPKDFLQNYLNKQKKTRSAKFRIRSQHTKNQLHFSTLTMNTLKMKLKKQCPFTIIPERINLGVNQGGKRHVQWKL